MQLVQVFSPEAHCGEIQRSFFANPIRVFFHVFDRPNLEWQRSTLESRLPPSKRKTLNLGVELNLIQAKKAGLNLVFPHIRALPEPLFIAFAVCRADPQKCISCYQFTKTTELITDIS